MSHPGVSHPANGSNAGTARWMTVLALAMLALGVLRLSAVVLHQPLAGYANQYDMARTSACLGLWPQVPRTELAAATRDAPLPVYQRLADVGGKCYRSTAAALAWVALHIDGAAEAAGLSAAGFSLRQLALWQAALLLAIALLLDRHLRAHPGARVAHAAFFALVLTDPFNTLYFATLYTEGAALLAWYASMALLLQLALARPSRSERSRSIGPWSIAALSVALLALGASRVQHLALPLALAVPAAVLLWRHRRSGKIAAMALPVLALGMLVWQLAQQATDAGIAGANRSNSVLGAALPASSDPAAMAARLGLDAQCIALEHATWYLPRGEDLVQACPGLLAAGPARLALALLHEPAAAVVFVGRGLAQSGAWRLPYVGEIAGAQYARVAHPSLADALARRSFAAHVVLWLAPVLALVLRLPGLLRTRVPGALDVMLLASVAVVVLGWLGALLGDGYIELGRHLHLAQNAALLCWTLLLAQLIGERRLRSVLAVVCAVVFAAVLGLGWLRMPLAEGVIDEAAFGDGALQVRGWVLDPSGVAAVELRLGSARAAAALQPAADVADMFPLGSWTLPTTARFSTSVSPAGDERRLSLWVRGRYGQWSEADALDVPQPAARAP